MLVAGDKEALILLTGQGDVVEPDDGILGLGSGGAFAQAAARALVKHTQLTPRQVVEESLKEAAALCIYTNSNVTIDELIARAGAFPISEIDSVVLLTFAFSCGLNSSLHALDCRQVSIESKSLPDGVIRKSCSLIGASARSSANTIALRAAFVYYVGAAAV